MTQSVHDERAEPRDAHDVRPPRTEPPRAQPLPRRHRFHVGQIIAIQIALALPLATIGHGPVVGSAATLTAVLLLLGAVLRLRRRWAYEWLAVTLSHLTRRRALDVGADATQLIGLAIPGAQIVPTELGTDTGAMIDDGSGFTVVLDLGDPDGRLAEAPQSLPSPATLLPPPDANAPPVRVQLLLTVTPAPAVRIGGGAPATSYRQLTDGRLPGHERALLALRVERSAGWSDDELHRSLSSAVRKARRRLAPVPARLLGETALPHVLAEVAHHDAAQPARETWPAIHLGGLWQATFRLPAWSTLTVEARHSLVPRLLTLPATATTVALTVGPQTHERIPIDLTVRLAASSSAELASAAEALQRLFVAPGASARRLDGEQLPGLAATLPLGRAADGPPSALPPAVLDGVELPLGGSGLMIGTNRHGGPVLTRLFRAGGTQALVAGSVRVAQLIALRAMALGARIVVQTIRPQAWEPFIRGASAPGGTISILPPGHPTDGPFGTALRPLLVVVDVGPVTVDQQPHGWQATLVLRDELAGADADLVARADLVVLQPLRSDEATLVGSALGLGDSAQWLTRSRADMVAVVSQRTLRWAQLSLTPIESQLVGAPTRQ